MRDCVQHGVPSSVPPKRRASFSQGEKRYNPSYSFLIPGTSFAFVRRYQELTWPDRPPDGSERAREQANAEQLDIAIQEADAEGLSFADASFDSVLSIFGVMFTLITVKLH